MEQVFFINPVAGKRDASAELVPRIQAAARQLQLPQPQIVVTQYAGQAREAARRYAASGTPVALYACGGDGTLNELVQGAAGSANVAVGCVPCGSGNDYVRNFGAAGQAPFLDFAAQLQAQPCRVDLLQTSLGIGIDICAAGLDAQVAYGIQNSGGCRDAGEQQPIRSRFYRLCSAASATSCALRSTAKSIPVLI